MRYFACTFHTKNKMITNKWQQNDHDAIAERSDRTGCGGTPEQNGGERERERSKQKTEQVRVFRNRRLARVRKGGVLVGLIPRVHLFI